MKYIDSEKLVAEIERRLKIVEPHKDTFESAAASRQELIWMKDFITSLQQEQPESGCSEKPNNLREQPEVDLEKEIERIVKNEEKFMKFQVRHQLIGYVARHFAEWGANHLNTRKEK